MNLTVSKTMYRGFFGLGTAVMLGALAAHALKTRLPADQLQVFETAVRYQFYGCIGLVLLALVQQAGSQKLDWPIILMRWGIIIFSGTLYFLSLRPLLGIAGYSWVGAITPLGGLSMIAAWLWAGTLFLRQSISGKNGE